MALRLVIEDDEGKTTVVPLIRDEITIGRQEGNTIRLTERNVSRRHARLVTSRDGGGLPMVLVEDLDSYNGVRLNGERINRQASVGPADLIQIGDYSLALRVDQPAAGREEDTRVDPEGPVDAALEQQATAVHHVDRDALLPEAQQARLVVVSSNLAGETFRLDRREIIVGRTADENDVIVNHRSISRNHAKIIYRDGTFTIIDLASSNGVKVNGVPFGTASMVNGDIVELGHVKLRYVAPGDDYVFSRADIDDADVAAGPGTGRLVMLGLLLVAVAVGTFLVFRPAVDDAAGKPEERPEAPKPQATVEHAAVDIGALLEEGRGHLDREQWAEAANVFGRILQADPEHAEAKVQRQRARREQDNEKRYQGVLKDADDRQWTDAYFALVDFPEDSVYHERLAQKRPRIEQGFADSELDRGRRLVEQADLEGARKVQIALAQKPFAAQQATTLAAAIADAEKASARAAAEKAAAEKAAAEKAAAERVVPADPPPQPPVVAAADPTPRTGPADAPARPRAAERRPAPARPQSAREDQEYQGLLQDALSALARGQRQKAVDLLKKAHKLRPEEHTPHQRLCAIYKPMGRLDEALFHCRKWLAMEPNKTYKPQIRRSIEIIEQELERARAHQ